MPAADDIAEAANGAGPSADFDAAGHGPTVR